MVYLVTWEINKANPVQYQLRRTALLKELEAYPEKHKDPSLDSVYFLATTWDHVQIYKDLSKVLNENDRLMIVRLEKYNHAGWLTDSTINWLEEKGL